MENNSNNQEIQSEDDGDEPYTEGDEYEEDEDWYPDDNILNVYEIVRLTLAGTPPDLGPHAEYAGNGLWGKLLEYAQDHDLAVVAIFCRRPIPEWDHQDEDLWQWLHDGVSPERWEELKRGAALTDAERLWYLREAEAHRDDNEASYTQAAFVYRITSEIEGQEHVVFFTSRGEVGAVQGGLDYCPYNTFGLVVDLDNIKTFLLQSTNLEFAAEVAPHSKFPEQGDIEAWLTERSKKATGAMQEHLRSQGLNPE